MKKMLWTGLMLLTPLGAWSQTADVPKQDGNEVEAPEVEKPEVQKPEGGLHKGQDFAQKLGKIDEKLTEVKTRLADPNLDAKERAKLEEKQAKLEAKRLKTEQKLAAKSARSDERAAERAARQVQSEGGHGRGRGGKH